MGLHSLSRAPSKPALSFVEAGLRLAMTRGLAPVAMTMAQHVARLVEYSQERVLGWPPYMRKPNGR